MSGNAAKIMDTPRADDLVGSYVVDAHCTDPVTWDDPGEFVIELAFRGTDDGSVRLTVPRHLVKVEEWPYDD